MNKKELIEMLVDFLCLKAEKNGSFEIMALGDTKEDGEYIIRDLKDIVYGFILNSERFGFTYRVEYEYEHDTIYGSKGYVCKVTVRITGRNDIINFWKIVRNSAIKKLREAGNLYLFHINWD